MTERVQLPQVVVLHSGGLDSTLLLKIAKDQRLYPIALVIDYEQKHMVEIDAAIRLCQKFEVPYRLMNIRLGNVQSALTGGGEGGTYTGVSEWHVPGRNTIFIGLAMSLAESLGVKKIWIGPNMDDYYNAFPDCMQSYIAQMNGVTRTAGSFPIELEAPLLGMRKDTIRMLAKRFGVDEEEVHSGYATE